MQLSSSHLMSMSSLHCLIMFHMKAFHTASKLRRDTSVKTLHKLQFFATCSGQQCPHVNLPQHSHNCSEVRSGWLATSCVATTCCQSWTCPNSPQQGAQVYVVGDWQQIYSLLWETCCQSVVSVDLRPPSGKICLEKSERQVILSEKWNGHAKKALRPHKI